MAIDTYQDMLKERGYQIVQSDALPPPFMPGLIINTRTPLVTGTKQVGAATVELQLQRVVGYRSGGLAGVARVSGVADSGEAVLTPNLPWSLYKNFTSGPKITVVLLWFFMLLGVWVVMLPGMVLILAMARLARASTGVKRFNQARAASALRFNLWGKSLDEVRSAMSTRIQDALMRAKFWGTAQVCDRQVRLDRFVGYGRYDLFCEVLDAADEVARG
ncbi:MAG: hypothetical protein IPJ65_12550 [Archangiaceae bacterium]|nr:hypothetical protein [Archangiaceae bacterium]